MKKLIVLKNARFRNLTTHPQHFFQYLCNSCVKRKGILVRTPTNIYKNFVDYKQVAQSTSGTKFHVSEDITDIQTYTKRIRIEPFCKRGNRNLHNLKTQQLYLQYITTQNETTKNITKKDAKTFPY